MQHSETLDLVDAHATNSLSLVESQAGESAPFLDSDSILVVGAADGDGAALLDSAVIGTGDDDLGLTGTVGTEEPEQGAVTLVRRRGTEVVTLAVMSRSGDAGQTSSQVLVDISDEVISWIDRTEAVETVETGDS